MSGADAWRSWCAVVDDESGPTAGAAFDLEIFRASVDGYREGLGRPVPEPERQTLVLATDRIALELALRFATDALEERYFAWDGVALRERLGASAGARAGPDRAGRGQLAESRGPRGDPRGRARLGARPGPPGTGRPVVGFSHRRRRDPERTSERRVLHPAGGGDRRPRSPLDCWQACHRARCGRPGCPRWGPGGGRDEEAVDRARAAGRRAGGGRRDRRHERESLSRGESRAAHRARERCGGSIGGLRAGGGGLLRRSGRPAHGASGLRGSRFGEDDFLTLDEAFVGVRLLPALQQRIEVSGIRLVAPTIHVIQTADGFNFASLGQSGEAPPDVPPSPRRRRREPASRSPSPRSRSATARSPTRTGPLPTGSP